MVLPSGVGMRISGAYSHARRSAKCYAVNVIFRLQGLTVAYFPSTSSYCDFFYTSFVFCTTIFFLILLRR